MGENVWGFKRKGTIQTKGSGRARQVSTVTVTEAQGQKSGRDKAGKGTLGVRLQDILNAR